MALVAVFGASGRQGLAQVRQLKAAGHDVRAISRSADPFYGETFEDVLGGRQLGLDPSEEQMDKAAHALVRALYLSKELLGPDRIYLCGGVLLSRWMKARLSVLLKEKRLGREYWLPHGAANVVVSYSPFGRDAGLYGAAALALFPPIGVFRE